MVVKEILFIIVKAYLSKALVPLNLPQFLLLILK